MKKNYTYIAIAFIVLGVVAALYYLSPFGSLSTILGEEGYSPYDTLLIGSSFDRAKWLDITPRVGQTVDLGAPNSGHMVTIIPYAGFTAKNGIISVGMNGQNLIGSVPFADTFRTANLRLRNYRMEVFTFSQRSSTAVTQCFGTSTGHQYGCVKGQYASDGSTTTTVELVWDDYEIGHYQLKINGALAEEGVIADGKEFYFIFQAEYIADRDFRSGYITIANPRVQSLFGCDPQSNEYIIGQSFVGPDVFTMNDLPGFNRFCVDHPALHLVNGTSGPSKQIYFALAKGQAVKVANNEGWKVFYIGSAQAAGITAKQCAEAIDAKTGDCTGYVDIVKPIIIQNLVDIKPEASVATEQTISWTSYGLFTDNSFSQKKTDFMSGSSFFMTTTNLKINEVSCPYTPIIQSYPQDVLRADCFSITSFGKQFQDGTVTKLNDYMTVTMRDLHASYYKDGVEQSYSWSSRWDMQFSPTSISISPFTIPAVVAPNKIQQETISVQNNLPGNVNVNLIIDTVKAITGEHIIVVKELKIDAGQRQNTVVDLDSTIFGDTKVTITPVLVTEAGNIQMTGTTVSYNVAADTVQEPTEPTVVDSVPTPSDTTTPTTDSSVGFFEKIWNWVIELFTV